MVPHEKEVTTHILFLTTKLLLKLKSVKYVLGTAVKAKNPKPFMEKMPTFLKTYWKPLIITSVICLLLTLVFNFYGLYTNRFYFFKLDAYLFAVISLAHFVYFYVIWFKIKEGEYPDVVMRNLEYVLYALTLLYLYKVVETFLTLTNLGDYSEHLISPYFLPLGTFLLVVHLLLLSTTICLFFVRRWKIGSYRIDYLNEDIDSWNR
ncbi:hypothetical protein VC82_2758 [Flagellimonas lutaonensis]|uniref:Uncharacterized protein n=1 Tax=Flagellimonas lutaonensis TaxID=516051 RepID=A0A0D5YVQ6_9FLAO|nr:hypothetical protein VC82_2758 [Allomuricauda lutaonensis]